MNPEHQAEAIAMSTDKSLGRCALGGEKIREAPATNAKEQTRARYRQRCAVFDIDSSCLTVSAWDSSGEVDANVDRHVCSCARNASTPGLG
jgi:hypothetical protein